MRIVAGSWAGRELESPGRRVRPTAEEVRDAALEWVARDLPEGRILDLFAGTGALGLEALSRGAAHVDFVEHNPSALHALKANVARFPVKDRTRIFKKDVRVFLASPQLETYDLAMADPPYTSALSEQVAERWLEQPFSRVLLVETGKDRHLPGKHKRRVLGDTALALYVDPKVPRSTGKR